MEHKLAALLRAIQLETGPDQGRIRCYTSSVIAMVTDFGTEHLLANVPSIDIAHATQRAVGSAGLVPLSGARAQSQHQADSVPLPLCSASDSLVVEAGAGARVEATLQQDSIDGITSQQTRGTLAPGHEQGAGASSLPQGHQERLFPNCMSLT